MSHETEIEFEDLARALREHRPSPEPEFSEHLDRAVKDHFPPEWIQEYNGNSRRNRMGGFGERLSRWLSGNRALLPTLAGAVGVLFIAAVVVSSDIDLSGPGSGSSDSASTERASNAAGTSASEASSGQAIGSQKETPDVGGVSADSIAPGQRLGPIIRKQETYQLNGSAASPEVAENLREFAGTADMISGKRDVAKEAEITLGTDPSGVQDVANEIVSVTDDHNGIIMNSNVTDGKAGRAGATFKLLIPSGQLESAVADLSGIADLRSRSQELTDITAPTNRAEDQIADSKAKIKSLLGELEETYDETERANLERRIRWERYDKRAAETRLNRLERRSDYTPVGVRIETGDSVSDDESGSWGLSDAVDDAGKMLGVAAGVTLIALAVAIPIGIVVLIALAINRAWVRRARRKVLDED